MIQHLLKKSDYIELEIFQTISRNSTNIDISTLMTEFSLSRSSVKRHVEQLNSILIKLNLEAKIVQDEKYYYCISNKSLIEEKNLFHHVQLFLLENSPTFNLLQLLFNSPSMPKYDYFEKLNISETTFYKLVKHLNEFLNLFSVKIAKRQEHFLLVGDEHHIRFLICAVFNEVYQNIKWPFQNKAVPQLKYYHSLNYSIQLAEKAPSIRIRNKILLTTLNIRTQNEFYTSAFDPLISNIMNIYINNNYNFNVNSFTYADTRYEDSELLFSEILLRIFDYSIDDEQSKITIGEQLQKVNNSLVSMCTELLQNFIYKFDILIDEDTHSKLMYYIVFHHVVILYFNFDLSSILKINTLYKEPLIDRADDAIKDVSTFYSQFIHKHNFPAFKTTETKKSVSELLYFILQISYKKTLNVYVHYMKDSIGTLLIATKINTIFNSSSITIVENISNADIIISDCIETSKNNSEYFFFDDIQNKKLWQELFSYLQSNIFKQNFHH